MVGYDHDPHIEPLAFPDLGVAEAILSWRFEHVWGLLVSGDASSPLPPAEEFPLPFRTGDHRVDMQVALAGLAPVWGFTSLLTTTPAQAREALARASVMTLSFLAQSARGSDVPAVQSWEVNQVSGIAERFLTRWQGSSDERFARAINAGWIALATDPDCPSIAVARRAARTGADVAACLSAAVAATSGPLASGWAARIGLLLREGGGEDAAAELIEVWGLRPREEIHHSPRAGALAQVAESLGTDTAPTIRLAEILAGFTHPRFTTEHMLTTIWATHLFTFAGVGERMLTAMFACGKTAGWSAAIATEHVRLLEKINR